MRNIALFSLIVCLLTFTTTELSAAEKGDRGAQIVPISHSNRITFRTLHDQDSIIVTVEGVDYRIYEEENAASIEIDGYESYMSPGDPVIPHRVLRVALPPNANVKTVGVSLLDVEQDVFEINKPIRPAPPFSSWDGTKTIYSWGSKKNIHNGHNQFVYATDAFFPAEPARVISFHNMREWKIVELDFYPVSYNPVTNVVQVIRSARLALSYDVTPKSLTSTHSKLADKHMSTVASVILDNYSEASSWYEIASEAKSGNEFQYVIITRESINNGSNKLDEFEDFKETQGFNVLTVTENNRYEDADGISTGSGWGGGTGDVAADNIRNWLSANYSSMGVEYVLLIGDPTPADGDVPMKMCWPRMNATYEPDHDNAPTDYFYADLTGNWDLDDDGNFGEYPDDFGPYGVDTAIEVYVGRIPVYGSSVTDLDLILQKTIDYGTDSGSKSWRYRVLLPMEPSDSSTDGHMLGEGIRTNYAELRGWSSYRIYDDSYGCSPEQTPCNPTNVENEWLNGYGLVTWWTHGSSTSAQDVFDVDQCGNLDSAHPSFTFQCSCTNGHPETTNNLGYSILRTGGIATVSASRVSWYLPGNSFWNVNGTNSWLAYQYSGNIIEGFRCGKALYDAKMLSTTGDAEYWMNLLVFNLYGDPATGVFDPGRNLTLISPNGGEILFRGRKAYITWDVGVGCGDYVEIQLYEGGDLDSVIVDSTRNDGSYEWNIPHSQAISSDYEVRVSSLSTAASDLSDSTFTIRDWVDSEIVEIWTCEQLQQVSTGGVYPRDAYYKLMTDIDCSSISNFLPIGRDPEHYFRGTFDGQGHKITELEIDRPGEERIGLFSVLKDSGTIKNLTLEGGFVSGEADVGALVGECAGTVVNCHSSAKIGRGNDDYPTENVGGLIGSTGGTAIVKNCSTYTNEEIRGHGDRVGGIVGENAGRIERCWCEADYIRSHDHDEVGGIAGTNYGTIIECYSKVEEMVKGEYWIGGIVGRNRDRGRVADCYSATGNITGDGNVGGIAGVNEGAIERCYVCSRITSSYCAGGIVGQQSGACSLCFWNITTTGRGPAEGVGCGNSCSDSYGLTDPEMKQQTHFGSAGWDFENVWTIDEGVTYPELRGVGYPLDAPTGVAASDNLWQYVLIQWNSVPPAAYYRVHRSDSETGTKIPLTNWQTELSFFDISAETSTPYYYWVQAATTNTGGRESDFGGPAVGIRLVQLPTIESINYPFSSIDGEYTVSWSESSGAMSYQLERSDDGGISWTEVYTGSGMSCSEDVDYGAYRYRVKATNAEGLSDWTTGTWDCLLSNGDIDKNGKVDQYDFSILADQWHGPPGDPSAEMWSRSGESHIDFLDFAVIAKHWLEGVTP